MPKLTKDELRQLQLRWYEKLSELGFKDIEKLKGDELVLAQSAAYCFRNIDPLTKFLKEEYFRFISQRVNDDETIFRNAVDKLVLTRHAEGARVKDIMAELLSVGESRTKETIRVIIRRYEMRWGIKSYTDRELRRYSKDK